MSFMSEGPWGSSAATGPADLLSSHFLLNDHSDPLIGPGLQDTWLDNTQLSLASGHGGAANVDGSGFSLELDPDTAAAIDKAANDIDWSQLSAELVDSDNSSMNALHTQGDLFSQDISPDYSLNPSPIFNMPLSDTHLSDVSLSPPDMIDPILFPPTPLSANTPVIGNKYYMPDSSHGLVKTTSNDGRKRKNSPVDEDPDTILKRQRNNVAARKYRQKRIDRITELEAEVEEMKKERDDLRLRLARQEAETAALKSMLKMKDGDSTKA